MHKEREILYLWQPILNGHERVSHNKVILYWFAFWVFIYLLYLPFLKNEKCNKNSWLFPASRSWIDMSVFMGSLFPNICNGVDSKWFDLEAEYKSLQAQVELRCALNLCLKYPKASYEKFLSMYQIKFFTGKPAMKQDSWMTLHLSQHPSST